MRPELEVQVRVLPHGEGLPLPERASAGAAGLDLRAAVTEPLHIPPGGRVLVPTGICLSIPSGFEGQVRARSGLAWRHGLAVLNGPGTIDSDYRGELKVLLANLGAEPVALERGQRVAQLVVAPVARAVLVRVESLEGSGRGSGGFGSTGAA